MNKYKQIITACGFSEEMERYLIGCKHNDYVMLDIILGAPLPLTEKRKLLELLNTPDSDGYADVSDCIREFDDALAALELKDGEEYVCWTEITKWIPVGEGKMKDVYSYTLVGNKIHYFKRLGETRRDRFEGYKSGLDLNLPIPFKPGDIVTLNCLPFRPVKHAVLLEVDNRDCCGVQMLYRLKEEKNGKSSLETGALKHGHGWKRFFPILSSLYRLSKYAGELTEEERILKDVQKHIYQNEEHGEKLWEFFYKSAPDEEELFKYLEKEYKD